MHTGQKIPVEKNAARSFALKAALWVLVLLATALPAFSQLTLGDNTSMNLSGNANFGYSHSSGTNLDTTSSTDLGFDATLTGFYYNPAFLSFRVNPYYNRSRTNSNSTSIFGAKGFTAGMNLFSGGHISGSFGYGTSFDNEQLLNVPGSVANYVARASSRSMELNGGLNFEGWPSLNVFWGTGSSSSTVFGTTMGGTSNARNFGLSSAYQLWGFSLSGGFTSIKSEQELPDLSSGTGALHVNTSQKTLRMGMTRQLWTSANLNTSFTRNTFIGESGPATQRGTYDTFSTFVAMRPLPKLNTSVFMNYTTNFGAYLFGNVLSAAGSGNGTSGTTTSTLIAVSGSDASNYLDYGTTAAYAFTSRLTATGQASVRRSAARNLVGDAKIATAGLSYGRPLFGGNIGVHGSISKSTSDAAGRSQSRVGESTGVTAGRRLFGWDFNSGFRYQRSSSDNSTALSVTQSGYGWHVNTTHRVTGAWRMQLGSSFNKNRIDQLAASESRSESYSAAFSGRKLGFAGSYSKTEGQSLQTINGLVEVDGGSVLPDINLVTFNGSSYSVSTTYHPMARFNISGDYSHALYATAKTDASTSGLLSRYNVRAEYTLRRMGIRAGFSHLTQGFGATGGQPATTNAFSIGVSRSFDIF